ncbi:MAG TPA: 30S ribosomal protein S16 [Dehalococcoidia bacterium]|nr:30S ribosomal protein S16 [Dehalococcoidia bacterium]
MLKIRLSRVGKKKRPSYRVVVADSRAPRDGAFIENIGHYNPLTDPATIAIDEEKALKWLRQGARPTERVAILLAKLGILEKPTKKHTEKLAKQLEEKPAKTPKKKPAKEKPSEEPEAVEEPAEQEPAEEKPSVEPEAEQETAVEKPADEESTVKGEG